MDRETLRAVLNTLNSIRVCGKEDMQKMLGLIVLFEGMLREDKNDEDHQA